MSNILQSLLPILCVIFYLFISDKIRLAYPKFTIWAQGTVIIYLIVVLFKEQFNSYKIIKIKIFILVVYLIAIIALLYICYVLTMHYDYKNMLIENDGYGRTINYVILGINKNSFKVAEENLVNEYINNNKNLKLINQYKFISFSKLDDYKISSERVKNLLH